MHSRAELAGIPVRQLRVQPRNARCRRAAPVLARALRGIPIGGYRDYARDSGPGLDAGDADVGLTAYV